MIVPLSLYANDPDSIKWLEADSNRLELEIFLDAYDLDINDVSSIEFWMAGMDVTVFVRDEDGHFVVEDGDIVVKKMTRIYKEDWTPRLAG